VGFNDRHLNFRVGFETERLDHDRTLLRIITLVRRNNCFGKTYLVWLL
jgi:hypothetical protein